MLADFSLNPKLQAACGQDVQKFCADVRERSKLNPFKSMVLFCLRVQFTKKVRTKLL